MQIPVRQKAETPIHTAVIGAGYWGRKLIRTVEHCKLLRLAAVADIKHRQLAAIHQVETTTDFSSLIQRTDIDAIVIATPPESHLPLAKQALLAGKHVLCEKPLTLSPTDCRHLATLATARQLCLMVDCTPVFLDEIQEAHRKFVWDDVESIRCVRTVKRAPRFPGELIWALAPHDLAILHFWLGSLPGSWSVAKNSPTTYRLSAYLDSGLAVECLVGQEQTPRRAILVRGRDITARFEQRQTSPEPLQQVVSHFADCIRFHRQPLTAADGAADIATILSDAVAGIV